MWPTGASRNHGNCEKAKKCSPSAVSNHRPCLEMFVTSIVEVVAPGIDNLLIVIFDQPLDFPQLLSAQIVIVRKFPSRFQPELGLSVAAISVNVHPGLLTRKEIKPIAVLAEHSRAHRAAPLFKLTWRASHVQIRDRQRVLLDE